MLRDPDPTQRSPRQKPLPKPDTPEEFREQFLQHRGRFTRKLLQTGAFIIENPRSVALNPLSRIEATSELSASHFVRLAKEMGFSGFSEMQAMFREPLHASEPMPRGERIMHTGGAQIINDPADIAAIGQAFARANVESLSNLHEKLSAMPLAEARDAILQARVVYVIGIGRSMGPAAYLSYALGRLGVQAIQLLGVGQALQDQARAMHADDLLVALSFPPYASETLQLFELVRDQGNPIVALTNSPVSPITIGAKTVLTIEDAELRGFRALTALTTVMQTLMVGVAYQKGLLDDPEIIDSINA